MIDLITKGGILMWPLLALSVTSLAVILEREFFFLRNLCSSQPVEIFMRRAAGAPDRIELPPEDGKILFRFFSFILKTGNLPPESADKEISLEGEKLLYTASKNIHLLELIGSISPMIGLSGTVLGMVKAFQELGISDSSGIDPALLANGIWIAMVTTVAGLFVAIPSLIFAHFYNNRVKKLAFEMKIYGEELTGIIRSGNRSGKDD